MKFMKIRRIETNQIILHQPTLKQKEDCSVFNTPCLPRGHACVALHQSFWSAMPQRCIVAAAQGFAFPPLHSHTDGSGCGDGSKIKCCMFSGPAPQGCFHLVTRRMGAARLLADGVLVGQCAPWSRLMASGTTLPQRRRTRVTIPSCVYFRLREGDFGASLFFFAPLFLRTHNFSPDIVVLADPVMCRAAPPCAE
jgi:hypothetical protein